MRSRRILVLGGLAGGAFLLWSLHFACGRAFQSVQVTFGPVAEVGAIPSPDGRWIAFEYFHPEKPGTPGIWLMPSEGSFVDALPLVDDGLFNGGPSWSPDSQWIGYVKKFHMDGQARISSQLFKVNIYTREVVQLTTLPDFSVVGGTTAWSNHGLIAFQWRGDIYGVSQGGGDAELVAAVQSGPLAAEPWNLSWAPDGKRIAFVADDPDSQYGEVASIWIFDVRQETFQRVTEGFMDWFPYWLDDDSMLFARVFSPKRGSIFKLNVSTRQLCQITDGAVDVAPVMMTGNHLLFSRSHEVKAAEDFQLLRDFHVWRKRIPTNKALIRFYRTQ